MRTHQFPPGNLNKNKWMVLLAGSNIIRLRSSSILVATHLRRAENPSTVAAAISHSVEITVELISTVDSLEMERASRSRVIAMIPRVVLQRNLCLVTVPAHTRSERGLSLDPMGSCIPVIKWIIQRWTRDHSLLIRLLSQLVVFTVPAWTTTFHNISSLWQLTPFSALLHRRYCTYLYHVFHWEEWNCLPLSRNSCKNNSKTGENPRDITVVFTLLLFLNNLLNQLR